MTEIPILAAAGDNNSRGSRDAFEKMLSAPADRVVAINSGSLVAQITTITAGLQLELENGSLDSPAFYVDTIEISLGVSAEGRLGLIALGQVSGSGNASFKLVLRRREQA